MSLKSIKFPYDAISWFLYTIHSQNIKEHSGWASCFCWGRINRWRESNIKFTDELTQDWTGWDVRFQMGEKIYEWQHYAKSAGEKSSFSWPKKWKINKGVQIKSFLGRGLFPKRIVLRIPKRANMICRVLRGWLRSWGQAEATARAQSIRRHSQWVTVKRVLQRGFVNFNKDIEMRPRSQCAAFLVPHWVSIIEKLENVIWEEKKSEL